jgi:hypothetical protein
VVVKGGLRRSSAPGSYSDLGILGVGIGHSSVPMYVGVDVSIMIG